MVAVPFNSTWILKQYLFFPYISISCACSVHAVDLSLETELLPPYKVKNLLQGSPAGRELLADPNPPAVPSGPDPDSQ